MLGIDKFLNSLAKNIAHTIRAFTAFTLVIFFLGAIFGFFAGHVAPRLGMPADWIIALPLILAVFAYYVTEIAFALFILFVIGFLLLLL